MPINSPFKFLDAYNKNDKEIFFGRDDEIETLYNMVFQSNLTLVYGQSGAGKTSLIQCGLANRFAESDWFNVYIRKNEDINKSLLSKLKEYKIDEGGTSSLKERLMKRRAENRKSAPVSTVEKPVVKEENPLIDTLQSVYNHYLKPVYLIFDQFEELFILGTKEEQEEFYQTISRILETESYCRVILIMREEAIAFLHDFEKAVPTLFDKRVRVEPMGRKKAKEVIEHSTEEFGIKLESVQVADAIIDSLKTVEKERVEPTYLQVFLDNLFQAAVKENPKELIFNLELVEELGTIENILGDFLMKQTFEVQDELKEKFEEVPKSAVKDLLGSFISLEGTKKPFTLNEISTRKLKPEWIKFIVDQLEKRRIIRHENDRYELSHDTLAENIADQREAEDIAILQTARLVKNRLAAFPRSHSYLTMKELSLVEQVENRLAQDGSLSLEEWDYVRKSKNRRRRKKIFRLVRVIGLVTGVLFVIGLVIRQQERLSEVEKEVKQEVSVATKFNSFMFLGNEFLGMKKYAAAIEVYKQAKNLAESNWSMDFVTKSEQDSIEKIIAHTLKKIEGEKKFRKLVHEADSIMGLPSANFQDTIYVYGFKKYSEANAMGFADLSSQLKTAKEKLKSTYKRYLWEEKLNSEVGLKRNKEKALLYHKYARKFKGLFEETLEGPSNSRQVAADLAYGIVKMEEKELIEAIKVFRLIEGGDEATRKQKKEAEQLRKECELNITAALNEFEVKDDSIQQLTGNVERKSNKLQTYERKQVTLTAAYYAGFELENGNHNNSLKLATWAYEMSGGEPGNAVKLSLGNAIYWNYRKKGDIRDIRKNKHGKPSGGYTRGKSNKGYPQLLDASGAVIMSLYHEGQKKEPQTILFSNDGNSILTVFENNEVWISPYPIEKYQELIKNGSQSRPSERLLKKYDLPLSME